MLGDLEKYEKELIEAFNILPQDFPINRKGDGLPLLIRKKLANYVSVQEEMVEVLLYAGKANGGNVAEDDKKLISDIYIPSLENIKKELCRLQDLHYEISIQTCKN